MHNPLPFPQFSGGDNFDQKTKKSSIISLLFNTTFVNNWGCNRIVLHPKAKFAFLGEGTKNKWGGVVVVGQRGICDLPKLFKIVV